MIPIRSHNRVLKTPIVTYFLILTNVIIFIFMLRLTNQGVYDFINRYALVPLDFSFKSLVTSQFLHGGLFHLVGNMLFLRIFGENVESRLGRFRYLIFYIFCGIMAGYLQFLVSKQSSAPVLGASGAIAGIMGSFLVLFPNSKIDVIVPLGFIPIATTIPAQLMLLYWIMAQFAYSSSIFNIDTNNIAYMAHIGGFFSGILFIYFFLPKNRKNN